MADEATVSKIIADAKQAIADFHQERQLPLVLSNPQSVSAVLADVAAYVLAHKSAAENLEAKILLIEQELG